LDTRFATEAFALDRTGSFGLGIGIEGFRYPELWIEHDEPS